MPFTFGVLASLLCATPLALHYFNVEGGLDWLRRPVGHGGTSLLLFAAVFLDLDRGMLVTAGYVITCTALVVCASRVRDNATFGTASITVVLVFLLFGMPLFSPWYHLWWLPLIALTQTSAWRTLFTVLAVLGPLSYLVHQATRRFDLSHQIWQWSLALAVPLLVALYRARPQIPDRVAPAWTPGSKDAGP